MKESPVKETPFSIVLKDFHVGASPAAHLDSLTEEGGAGSYSTATSVDVLTPKILTQGPGLAALTNGTQAGVVDELITYILDRPVVDSVTYAMGDVKLFKVTPTTVTSDGTWPHTITGGNSGSTGNSVAYFQGNLYYFFNKASGAEIGKYDLNVTFTDNWGSTVPTGAAALQNAPHPVAMKQDIMLFGNGQYVGTYISTTNTLTVNKLDFGTGTTVADVAFHANQWWLAVNTGVTTGTNRASGQIYLYDGSATSAILADEVAVGIQKIGFILPLNGVVFVAYQDLSGAYAIGYVSSRRLLPLEFFTGSLPNFAQKTLYKNFIAFASGGSVFMAGAIIPDLPYAISQHASGGYATSGAVAAPFGTLIIASTASTNFQLAQFSNYTVTADWRSLVVPTSAGIMIGYIDRVVVLTRTLSSFARCDLIIEANQATLTGSTQQIKPGSTLSAVFTANVSDVITSVAHGLANGDVVVLTTTGTLPAGLTVLTAYYVVSKTTDTFKLSATSGGAAIDITDTGTGVHTFANVVDKRRHVFNSLGLTRVEDFRVFLNWANGSTANRVKIREIQVVGHFVEQR